MVIACSFPSPSSACQNSVHSAIFLGTLQLLVGNMSPKDSNPDMDAKKQGGRSRSKTAYREKVDKGKVVESQEPKDDSSSGVPLSKKLAALNEVSHESKEPSSLPEHADHVERPNLLVENSRITEEDMATSSQVHEDESMTPFLWATAGPLCSSRMEIPQNMIPRAACMQILKMNLAL